MKQKIYQSVDIVHTYNLKEKLIHNKIYIILNLLIILFSLSIVNKTLQNDTFFSIPIGNYVLQNGATTQDQLTWHDNLKFEHSGEFSSLMAILYNLAGFNGIYCFTLIMTALIGLVLFYILIKSKNNILISFFTTITALYFGRDSFVARAQIVSYLMFLIEIYLIEKLIQTQRKTYCLSLVIVCIIIANFHASVWPMYFILFLPYIAEFIFKKLKLEMPKSKLIAEEFPLKLLIITMILAGFSGLCTPSGIAPYTDMIKVISGISMTFISELERVKIIENYGMLISLAMYGVVMCLHQTKIKVSDLCMATGLFLMGLMAERNIIFFYLIGAIVFARIVTNIENINIEMDKITQKLSHKNAYLTILSLVIIVVCVVNYKDKIKQDFINENLYPVEAAEYILENLDIPNTRIFNHFNFGSYLEFKNIPVFIDSRSGMYCKEFNNTSILEDWMDVSSGSVHYKEIFSKYHITHVLLYKQEIINTYISNDTDYTKLYEDKNFVLYENEARNFS